MNDLKNIKVTTTSNFDNNEITEYLEPVSAHIVIGMNFFKDFLAGFTDFFGGNSHSYQNILASINEQAIEKIRKKAYTIGANCVVGLKIDNDEIGAQGKSMMMVTATGTAAIANFTEKSNKIEKLKKLNSVSNDLYDVLFEKREYLEKSKKNKLEFDDDFWSFVKKQKVGELADYIINEFEKTARDYVDYNDNQSITLNAIKKHIIEYFMSIDYGLASACIYEKLTTELHPKTRRHISDILIKSNLVDYEKISTLLKNPDFLVQKSAIQICSNHKLSYEVNDISLIENIVDSIKSNFKERGVKSTKKKMLSSKENNIWICECNKENNSIDLYCSSCGNDISGFSKTEIKPNELIDKLNSKIEILKDIMI